MSRNDLSLRVGALLCALWTTGCTESSEGGAVPFDQLPTSLGEALCDVFLGCVPSFSVADTFGEGGCPQYLTAQIEDSAFYRIGDAIEAGTVDYDGSKADACLAELRAVGCELDTRRVFLDGACAELVSGTVEPGGECVTDAECTGAAYCDFDASCPGSCRSLQAEGEACEDHDQCEDGLHCQCMDGDCGTQVCRPQGAPGEPCGGPERIECQIGASCAGGGPLREGVCRTQASTFSAEEGESCQISSEPQLCEDGLFCEIGIGAAGVERSTCVAGGADSGGPCKAAIPDPCPTGEYCDAALEMGQLEGTCTPTAAAGEACGEGAAPCGAGLVCDGDTCSERGRIGDACETGEGCTSERCDDGVCVRDDPCPE